MRYSIAITAALALSGCSSFDSYKGYEDIKTARSGKSTDIVNRDKIVPEDINDLLAPFHYNADGGKTLIARSATERNITQSRLIAKSDINCTRFIETIHNTRAASNISYGFWSIATATAASIVSGRAGQNLAGISAVSSATSQTINDELYSGVLMPNITREIKESRERKYSAMIARHAETTDSYSYELAVADAIQYHNLCSVPTALASIIGRANIQEAGRKVTYKDMLSDIDGEISKMTTAISNQELDLSDEQKAALRNDIFKLMTKRSKIVEIYALPAFTRDTTAQTIETLKTGTSTKQTEETIIETSIEATVPGPAVAD